MEELPLTGKRLRSIWWAWLWRSFVATILAVVAEGAILAAYKISDRDPADGREFASAAAAVVALILSPIVVQLVLRKKYREFRIALIAREVKQT